MLVALRKLEKRRYRWAWLPLVSSPQTLSLPAFPSPSQEHFLGSCSLPDPEVLETHVGLSLPPKDLEILRKMVT